MKEPKKVGILLSGRGSNFLALSDAAESGRIPAEIALVISNRQEAPGLAHARQRGYRALFLPSKGREREEFDREVVKQLKDAGVEIVCLAGFMRLLSPYFIRSFPMQILNIHPSLLPAFPGLHAQRQALEWGVKVTGCTVHFVDEDLDHGPIIVQRAVSVLEDDTEETLSTRILEQEHLAYPEALGIVCEGRWRIAGRRLLVQR
ncbi:MAG TPA: phosphoribosylglycinamide formyltransferase [Acidobacteriota bacterium]|nr:phosphoribosylglycinamide formyltransferase [Acidobacteriota bacterium]